jgi:DNA-binding CsgD family transcriptional regulator
MKRFSVKRPLTPRQKQALLCYARGISAIDAGKAMKCSPRTVESLRAVAMGKVGAKRLHDVIAWAVRETQLSVEQLVEVMD